MKITLSEMKQLFNNKKRLNMIFEWAEDINKLDNDAKQTIRDEAPGIILDIYRNNINDIKEIIRKIVFGMSAINNQFFNKKNNRTNISYVINSYANANQSKEVTNVVDSINDPESSVPTIFFANAMTELTDFIKNAASKLKLKDPYKQHIIHFINVMPIVAPSLIKRTFLGLAINSIVDYARVQLSFGYLKKDGKEVDTSIVNIFKDYFGGNYYTIAQLKTEFENEIKLTESRSRRNNSNSITISELKQLVRSELRRHKSRY